MFKWIKEHPRTFMDIARFIALLAVLVSFVFLLHQISNQNKSRASNLNALIKDNANQTQVLCTLILSSKIDTANISAKDLGRIETICKERIKSTTPEAASIPPSAPAKPSSLSVTAPQPQSKVSVSSSSPQSAPNTNNTQADKPLPTPDPSMFQQILNATSDTLEILNPFN
jgi:hypothetical protein